VLPADPLGRPTPDAWRAFGAHSDREAGVEKMDAALRTSPIAVTNYQRTFAPAITETAMGHLVCLTRGIVRDYMPQFYKRQMKPAGTAKSADHVELAGRTTGIVGTGGIGSMLARRAHYGFDMRIVATDAKPVPRPDFVAELHDPSWFPKMAAEVDVLVGMQPSPRFRPRLSHRSQRRRQA
jgi:lactate dehydrogenase-like 2-hydroxyacid dehydrogenase